MGHYLVTFNGVVGAFQVPGDKVKILTLIRRVIRKHGALTLIKPDVTTEPKKKGEKTKHMAKTTNTHKKRPP